MFWVSYYNKQPNLRTWLISLSVKVLLSFILVVIASLFAYTQAQQKVVRFKHFSVITPDSLTSYDWRKFREDAIAIDGRYTGIVQMNGKADILRRRELQRLGIILHGYVPDNAYIATFNNEVSVEQLHAAGIRTVFAIPIQAKLSVRLQKQVENSREGILQLWLKIADGTDYFKAVDYLQSAGAVIVDTALSQYSIITIHLPAKMLPGVQQLSFVEYIDKAPPPDKKLNIDVVNNAKANVVQAPVSAGGEGLQGKGVVIGIGDDADITSHADVKDRVINRSAFLYNNHGVQIAGTAAGSGIIDPLFAGVAPQATIVSQLFNGIIKNAPAYVNDYGMVVTNNSYGSISGECDYEGIYDLYSVVLDRQAFELPQLLHVFAVGNDGPFNLQCDYNGYRTVLGGYQSSKNVLDVGWGDKNATISPGSSYGPVRDGRLKPEIAATGSEVRSPGANNGYVTDYGSSLSAPAVAGGAALLIEKYRQLNNGNNPPSALVKAALMNGATDIENIGPDFKSGFGWLNLIRSVDILKNKHYISGSITQGISINHSISVPAGLAKLKVMIYWHDPAAAVFAGSTLVNDLDMELISASGDAILPWILDTSAGNLSKPATRGRDHLNNEEQVTIDNPDAGNYQIKINGTAINANSSQSYFIVYDFIYPGINLTFPSVGEPLVPYEDVVFKWDAYGHSTATFSLLFSKDNGVTYSSIAGNIGADIREFRWNVPPAFTNMAKIKLVRNDGTASDESLPFVIARTPVISFHDNQCPGYMAIYWQPLSEATDYEVMLKRGAKMVPVGITNNTSFVIDGLDRDSLYWVTVRARINGNAGRRAVAISKQPNTGACQGNISNNDLLMDSLLLTNGGRLLTSSRLNNPAITVAIKNLDDVTQTNVSVGIIINGTIVRRELLTVSIPPLGMHTHTFSGMPISAAGVYNIAVFVYKDNDSNRSNDTIRKVIRHIDNSPVDIPYFQNFESAPSFEINGNYIGLPSVANWDVQSSTKAGRVRSFINSGMAFSGSNALTLDVAGFIPDGNVNYLTGTFNVLPLNKFVTERGLTLSFSYKLHGETKSSNNRVWIRPNDTAQWIPVFNFDTVTAPVGVWRSSPAIYVDKILSGRDASTSFQVRFGQQGRFGVNDNTSLEGLSIDDFSLYYNPFDFSITGIVSPIEHNCGSAATVPLQISTAGNRTASTIKVNYKLDGGSVVTENFIGGIGTYTFNKLLDLSAPGKHILNVWLSHDEDINRTNDSILNYVLYVQPVISIFPYLQNFELGTGNWYPGGTNASWQYGTPAGYKINKAASGTKAWKTGISSTYNDDELSYLYSPCFNIGQLKMPYISFSMALDIEQCRESICDKAWMEYSTDGSNWTKLGTYGTGTNWYNRNNGQVWDSASFSRWHVATAALPQTTGVIRFRFVMQSDAFLFREGIAVDDIHIYDREFPLYDQPSLSSPVTVNVTDSVWKPFVQNGEILAAIKTERVTKDVTAQIFIRRGGSDSVRNYDGVYYLNRSFVLQTKDTLHDDSLSLRLYYTDKEIEHLTDATSCNNCTRATDAYSVGISKFNDAVKENENDTLTDNVQGKYTFIDKGKLQVVPYDKGYFAEIKVADLSEFWFNSGTSPVSIHPHFVISSFAGIKQEQQVRIQFSTISEVAVAYYIVEVARGNAAYAAGQYQQLTRVNVTGQHQNTYNYTDAVGINSITGYYRIAVHYRDGSVRYSYVLPVVHINTNDWVAYPNPVKDNLTIKTQAEAGSKIYVQVFNGTGHLIHRAEVTGNGFLQNYNLNTGNLASGVYFIRITANNQQKTIHVIKQ